MKKFLSNKWAKLGFSLSSIIYTFIIFNIAYSTFLYNMVIDKKVTFAFGYIILNALFLLTMFFSRKQIITSIMSMFFLLFVFFILIFNFGNWILIVPAFIVSTVMFFGCKANETLKTVLGTVYILLFVLGLIAFFLVRFLFSGSISGTKLDANISDNSQIWSVYSRSSVSEALKNSISPDGKYRYYILDIEDNASGRIELYVEPNNNDKKHKLYTLYERGREKIVAKSNTRGDTNLPKVEWTSPNKIKYQFGEQPAKETIVTEHKKDYFSFLFY